MSTSDKKIGTLEELVISGPGKHIFASNRSQSTVDREFAENLLRKHRLYDDGDSFTYTNGDQKTFVITYRKWEGSKSFNSPDLGFYERGLEVTPG